ncbi:hypothetical protein HMPREF3291_05325 [Bacillus sp. HMSC76G11]|nr:hypothetical protein HMPREF3291_05325 [Bacillus sp. HMSC76G11]
MARIDEGVLRQYNPGDRMTDIDYERDREILRVSINDLDDKYQLLRPENIENLKDEVEIAKTDDEGTQYLSLKDRLDSEKVIVSEQLAETMKYSLANYEIAEEVIRRDLPHFHVERYGAVGDYNPTTGVGTDDTVAFQRAVDAALRAEGGKILFEKKNYLINGTVYINPTSGNFPIYLSGKSSALYRGTLIYKETPGDFFKTNLKADDSTFMDAATQFYHFGVENLTLTSKTRVAGSGFRMFRTRTRMTNVTSNGLEKLVAQPATDSLGNVNYCDMSEYRGITINYPRIGGLELNKPDGSKIERIYIHYPEPTCTSYILVRNGGGFNISNAVFAWHMTNDGVAIDNTNAYIKITGADGFTVDNIYVERTHMSNMFYINDSKNWKVTSIYERFLGNNAFYISNCHTGDIDGIYRHSTKTTGYCDIYFAGTSTNLTIRKFRIRDYSTATKRDLDLQGTLPSDLKGEIVQIGILYDGAAWKVVDSLGVETTLFGLPVWTNNDGAEFPANSPFRYGTILSMQPRYAGASNMPFMPVINVPNTKRIAFYDQALGSRTQTVGTKMNCTVILSVPMAV